MGSKLSTFHLTLLVVFGALAAAGVLVFALATASGGKAGVGPVKIWGPFPATQVNSILRQAADNDPQLEQVSYEQKDPTAFTSELTNALASGKGPDLFFMRQDETIRDGEKTNPIPPESLSSADFQNSFLEAAEPFFTPSGVVAVPLLVDPLVLYWNRDLLESKGYAGPPKYWDDVLVMSRSMTVRDDAGTIKKSAIAFGEFSNIPNAKDILSMLILQAGGSITAYSAKGVITPGLTPQAKTGQGSINALRFYTEFADPTKDTYTWSRSFPSALQAFASGDVGLYVGHASERSLIAATNPNLSFGIAPIPQIRTQGQIANTATVYGLAISRTAKNPVGARTVTYLMGTSLMTRSLAGALNMSSALRSALTTPAKGDQEIINRQALIARSWIDPDPAKTGEAFRAMIEDTTSGAIRVDQAIVRADKQLEEAIHASDTSSQ